MLTIEWRGVQVREAASAASAEESVDDPIGVAFIGMGVAGRLGASAANASPFCRVVAVCDLDRDALMAAAAQFGGRPILDVTELCDESDIEAVYIATPTHLHLENVKQLAEAGKHLLIEKPVVVNPDEGRRLVEIVRATGRRVMAVNTRGRDAPVRAMARLVREGAVGRVRSLTNISYTSWMLRPRFDYELVSELGGGVIFRQAPPAGRDRSNDPWSPPDRRNDHRGRGPLAQRGGSGLQRAFGVPRRRGGNARLQRRRLFRFR